MTSCPFSRWQPAAVLDLILVMLDHPCSAIIGLSLVLKFGLDPISAVIVQADRMKSPTAGEARARKLKSTPLRILHEYAVIE